MKKQKKQLIILSLALVLCVALYSGLRLYLTWSENRKTEAETIPVLSLDPNEIKQISFDIDEENYSFVKQAGEDGSVMWSCLNDPTISLNQTIMNVKAGYLENVRAKEYIGHTDKLDDMGLTESANIVTITSGDAEYQLILGGYNWLLSGYYISYNDEVYLVGASIYNAFTCTLDSMLAE